MTWPRKNTRTVVVGGEIYQWHIDPKESLWRWIVIRKKSADGQLLFLDPYWLSTTPGQICQAINFAISAGWEPHRKSQPLQLGSKLVDVKTLTFEFHLLSNDTAPGVMPELRALDNA